MSINMYIDTSSTSCHKEMSRGALPTLCTFARSKVTSYAMKKIWICNMQISVVSNALSLTDTSLNRIY